jgi:hypothetical protein
MCANQQNSISTVGTSKTSASFIVNTITTLHNMAAANNDAIHNKPTFVLKNAAVAFYGLAMYYHHAQICCQTIAVTSVGHTATTKSQNL